MKLLWILACSCVLAAYSYAATIPIVEVSVSDVVIRKTDKFWKCDKINCPKATNVCQVSKRPIKINQKIHTRINECLDKNFKPLLRRIFKESHSKSKEHVDIFMTKNGQSGKHCKFCKPH